MLIELNKLSKQICELIWVKKISQVIPSRAEQTNTGSNKTATASK